MNPREKTPDASEMRQANGCVDTQPATRRGRNRRRPFDGRTREGRRWRSLFAHYMQQSGGRCELLCRQAASLIVERERLDGAIARGEGVDTLQLVRLCGAINRTLDRLGAVEGPAVDATAEVIAHIRAATEAA